MIATVMADKGTVRASPGFARNLPRAKSSSCPIPTPVNDSPTTLAAHEWEFRATSPLADWSPSCPVLRNATVSLGQST
jgi:hypothetical protein